MDEQWQTNSFSELTREDLYALLRLRQEVFVVEQQSAYLDLDGLDDRAVHMRVLHNGTLIAYQRCLPPGLVYSDSALGRIVVAAAARGRHLGRDLVRKGIEYNLARWPGRDIRINAQSYLQEFYTSMGFRAEGEEHAEDGIMHRYMRYRAA